VKAYGGAAALIESPPPAGDDNNLSCGGVIAVVRGVADTNTRFNFQVTEFCYPSDDEDICVDTVSFKISDGVHCVSATCLPGRAKVIQGAQQPNPSIIQAQTQLQCVADRVVLRSVEVVEDGLSSSVIGNPLIAMSRPASIARSTLTGQPPVSYDCPGHSPDHPDFAYLPPCQCRGECTVAQVTEGNEGG
jgi:hypothetical protein